MTEEEITKMAILKAQADSVHETRITQNTSSQETVPQAQPELEQTILTKTEDSPTYPYTLNLGNKKNISFKAWTGKTKKQIKAISESEDVTNKEIIDILIRENISPDTTYLSVIETQYVMLHIRAKSLDNLYIATGTCAVCEGEEEIEIDIYKDVNYKPGMFPKTLSSHEIDIIDISSYDELLKVSNDYMDSADYDGITTEADIEIAMHIKNGDMTPLEILDWMDNLDLKNLSIVTTEMNNLSPDFSISKTHQCVSCDKEQKFNTLDLPDVFVEILE